jgi:hypothetical protein
MANLDKAPVQSNGLLARTAETIGATLGRLAAKTGLAKPESGSVTRLVVKQRKETKTLHGTRAAKASRGKTSAKAKTPAKKTTGGKKRTRQP